MRIQLKPPPDPVCAGWGVGAGAGAGTPSGEPQRTHVRAEPGLSIPQAGHLTGAAAWLP